MNVGNIDIKVVDGGTNKFYRVTVNTDKLWPLDQLEGEGETLAEALLKLHEEVEIFEI